MCLDVTSICCLFHFVLPAHKIVSRTIMESWDQTVQHSNWDRNWKPWNSSRWHYSSPDSIWTFDIRNFVICLFLLHKCSPSPAFVWTHASVLYFHRCRNEYLKREHGCTHERTKQTPHVLFRCDVMGTRETMWKISQDSAWNNIGPIDLSSFYSNYLIISCGRWILRVACS